MSDCLGLTLIFSQTLNGITFQEEHEYIIKLFTFLLKISKVTRKGTVVDLDLFHDREAFIATCILGVFPLSHAVVLIVTLFVPTLISSNISIVLP
jgi:hypothetical protein